MKPDQKWRRELFSSQSPYLTAENASQMLFSPLVNAKAGENLPDLIRIKFILMITG